MQPTACGVCGVVGKRLVAVAGKTQHFCICTSCYFSYFIEPGMPVAELFDSREKKPFITMPY